jgi:hypothetical protein
MNPALPIFAFLLTVLYWPGVAESADTPRWAMISAVAPFLLLNRAPRLTPWVAPLLGVFLAWAWASLLWTPALWDGLDRCWRWTLAAAMVLLGATLTDKEWRWTLIAFSAGVALNGALALGQYLQWQPALGLVEQVSPPAGTFLNKNRLAEAAALALAGLLGMGLRARVVFPLLVPAALTLVLAGSRIAAIAAAGAALIFLWPRARVLAIGLGLALFANFVFSFQPDTSVAARLSLWRDTLANLAPLGRGAGSWVALYPSFTTVGSTAAYRFGTLPEHPHNEAVYLLFELGPAALALPALFVLAWRRGAADDDCRFVLAAFGLIALAAFPLALPASVGLAALALGRALRRRDTLRGFPDARRSDLQSGPRYREYFRDPLRDDRGFGGFSGLGPFARGARQSRRANGPGRSDSGARVPQERAAGGTP